jgi:hypothetical protein
MLIQGIAGIAECGRVDFHLLLNTVDAVVRSSGGGDGPAEASGVEGRYGDSTSVQAVT